MTSLRAGYARVKRANDQVGVARVHAGLPTNAALHAELTADNTSIVLIAVGADVWIAKMARWMQTVTPLVKKSDPPGALVIPATWAAVVQLSTIFGELWHPGPRLTAWTLEQMLARSVHGSELAIQPPEGLTPRPYQIEGARMIASVGRSLIFDDPGTGKTITTILGLVDRAQVAPVLPVIVIAPASVVDPWVEALRRWVPQWRSVAWRGDPKRRKAMAGTADVYVTSYDTARADSSREHGPLMALKARAVVVDECHLIKNPTAARSQAARRLARKADVFVALSGTPITHNSADLWPALEGLEPRAWPSRERWTDRYCTKVQGDYSAKVTGLAPHTEEEFRTVLMGQYRRVSKADVLSQLPPKVYSVRVVELPAEWRKAYDDFEAKMYAELPDGQELSVMQVLTVMNFLAALASAPADVRITTEIAKSGPREGEEVEHIHLDLKAPSWKVDALLEVLAERPGEPVVAFAPSRQLVMLAGEAATKAGLQVGYVVGGQSMAERTETVEAFQKGKLDLLCVTTQAGGVGLTLTAAKTVVFLQRPWSIVDAIQAEDRCHRIGSEIHDSIEIIDIVAANTIDSRVRSALYEKAGQLSDLLQDPRIVAELLGGLSVRKGKVA